MTELAESSPVHDETPPYSDSDAPPGDNVHPIRPNPALEAEQALLAALIREPWRLPTVIETVDPDDFDNPHHATIYQAITTVADRDGIEPDHIVVAEELRRTKQHAALKLLATYDCPNPSSAKNYAHIVHQEADRRRIAGRIRQALTAVEHGTPDTWLVSLAQGMDSFDRALRFAPAATTGHVNYVTFDGLFARERTPVRWVRAPLLAQGRITLMYSPGKAGKSLIAMEAAAAIATGKAAFATDPQPPGHVLYVDQEMTEDDWLDRLSDMGYGTDDEKLLSEHLHLAQLQAWPPMDTHAGGQALANEAARVGATTVIIDTVSKVIAGEENANDTQQALYQHTFVPLKRAGAAVLVLDHTGKDVERGARGASAKTDNIDLAFELLQRGRDLLTLRCTHARIRDELLDQPTFLRRATDPLHHVIELHEAPADSVRPTHLMERVSTYVLTNPGATKQAIETAVKGKAQYVRLALELLVNEQYIEARAGENRAVHHHNIRHYTESEDPS